MRVPGDLEPLVEIDRLAVLEFDVPTFAHDDHRFVLPLVHYGQDRGQLPRPCKVVMLDQHHDALAPRSEDAPMAIRRLRQNGITHDSLLRLTTDDLSALDDDWLRAGMELGLFSDAVIFGTDQTLEENPFAFEDHMGVGHHIYISSVLPGECFGLQGSLSDAARGYATKPLWELLEWNIQEHGFGPPADKLFLTVDLDAFVMPYEEFTFAWRPEVWEKRFLKEADYLASTGWTGKRFVRELLGRVGLMTIAREPAGCGGEAEMMQIFRDFNRYVFDGAIKEIGG